MKFSGELVVPAPREAVFDRLRDANFFASCVEGVSGLTELTPDRYAASFVTKIAYIRFEFEVTVAIAQAERPHSIQAQIEGKPHGVVGRLAATSAARFEDDGAGTKVIYDIEASLTGRLGSIGQPVLKSKAREMEKHFVAKLREAFSGTGEQAA
jgi:carbon monoxide dehydrogenase subunit G